jgi:hypothetical protein
MGRCSMPPKRFTASHTELGASRCRNSGARVKTDKEPDPEAASPYGRSHLHHDRVQAQPNRHRQSSAYRCHRSQIWAAPPSTTDQTAGLAAQERDLKTAGAEKMFSEQVSNDAQRARLTKCLAFLREGDVLMVTKPDRLTRSTAAIEADLSKRGVGLVVLSMGGERLDTRNPTSELMLTILATWESEIMLERQRQGQSRGQIQGPRCPYRRGGDPPTDRHDGSGCHR